jgi:NAD(P)H-hydrate epimerase
MNSIETIIALELDSRLKSLITKSHITVDGIFGTGIRGKVSEPHLSAIDYINESKGYIVAIDVPSGLDPNTGKVHDRCVRANATVTFHRMKVGLKNNTKYTGSIFVEWIGIPREAEKGVVMK